MLVRFKGCDVFDWYQSSAERIKEITAIPALQLCQTGRLQEEGNYKFCFANDPKQFSVADVNEVQCYEGQLSNSSLTNLLESEGGISLYTKYIIC